MTSDLPPRAVQPTKEAWQSLVSYDTKKIVNEETEPFVVEREDSEGESKGQLRRLAHGKPGEAIPRVSRLGLMDVRGDDKSS